MDDALHATRAAVEEGVLPGGGVALLRAQKALDTLQGGESRPACRMRSSAEPSRLPPARSRKTRAPKARSLSGNCARTAISRFGWNAQTGEYGDLYQMGVIDPVKVVRAALQDAASIAGLLVTTEAMVAEKPKKEASMPAMPGGGMDF